MEKMIQVNEDLLHTQEEQNFQLQSTTEKL